MRLMADLDDIAGRSHQTLRYSKTCRQFSIFAGCPHDHRDTMAFDADFEWFFSGQTVPIVGKGKGINSPHGNFFHSAGR